MCSCLHEEVSPKKWTKNCVSRTVFLCICMYVLCTHVHTYIHTCMYTHANTSTQTHTHMHQHKTRTSTISAHRLMSIYQMHDLRTKVSQMEGQMQRIALGLQGSAKTSKDSPPVGDANARANTCVDVASGEVLWVCLYVCVSVLFVCVCSRHDVCAFV